MPRSLRTPQAEADLIEIGFYILQANPSAALDLLDKIDQKCQTLAHSPEIGRRRDDLSLGLRSFPVDNYILYYRVDPDGIVLMRVIHGARSQQEALRYRDN